MADPARISIDSPQVPAESDTPSSTDATSRNGDFRAAVFAERSFLSWWFPQIDHDETNSFRIWRSRRSRALMAQILAIGLVLVTNVTTSIFAIVKYGSQDGVGLVYKGDCDTVKRLSLWTHLVINLLGTAMLSASNYCMQLQASPTRENINKAHAQGRWLDIGIPSLRNLWYIGWRRVLIWLLLAASSVPIHLLYNSAVFQSLSSNNYAVAVVKDSFVSGSPFNLTTAMNNRAGDPGWDEYRVNPDHIDYASVFTDLQRDCHTYKQMNISSCFELYDDYWKPQGNALILVRNRTVQSPSDDSLLMYVYVVPRWDDWGKNMWALGNSTREYVAQLRLSQQVTHWYLGPPRYEVSSCLVQDPSSIELTCRFEYSPHILITVCLMNLAKLLIMLWAWFARRRETNSNKSANSNKPESLEILYTLGDAIASFMKVPDPTTRNMCLATKDDFLRTKPSLCSWRSRTPKPSTEPRLFRNEPKFWMQAASMTRWVVLIAVCCFVLLSTAALLAASIKSLRHRKLPTSMPGLAGLGFGAPTPYTYLVMGLPRDDPTGLISNVLIANLPQLFLSLVYVLYNAMLSTFLVQREFSHCYKAAKRKPLRVSEPMGIQRSSYFISMPLRYGLPLYATSGIMHFLLSQSLFLARITALFANGTVDRKASFSTCAYSPIAIITGELSIFAGCQAPSL
ncbi:hypothetical protein QQS21_006048 [Conoideocrella luteorostrata]|uniref:DUF6536 domain-containing protein n=1 Tax=Conoideocrella luteorostrata TaxID=1105319 RepID=A0AAJ0CNB1_9HYPO|nr:hypothetical protein QQS21_006048 [Conoideocrella luteorostrata]